MFNRMNLTYPLYFENFKCIGGECEDTCCKGWDIEVDKDTFQQYCHVKDEKMKVMLKNNICKNDDCTSNDLDYGIIKLNNKGICPFLDKNKYCSIYTKIGEEYLSNICTNFPRILNKIDNKYEISLDVACPEAARLILLQEDSITFTHGEKVFNKYIINDEYNTNSKKYRNSPIKYIKEIRGFSIKIMQNRNFTLADRLYILGESLKRLEDQCEDDSSKIIDFINKYNINNTLNLSQKDNMNYIFQIIFFKGIVDSSNIVEKSISDAFKMYTKELLEGFNIKNIDDFRKNDERYIEAFKNYDREVIQNHSYIFENYIVNFMYNNLFPFSESDSIFEGYIMLLVRYSFIRFYLVGRYINSGNDSPEDITRFISVFSRAIEHDKNYLPELLMYIEENEYYNMDFAKKLL